MDEIRLVWQRISQNVLQNKQPKSKAFTIFIIKYGPQGYSYCSILLKADITQLSNLRDIKCLPKSSPPTVVLPG